MNVPIRVASDVKRTLILPSARQGDAHVLIYAWMWKKTMTCLDMKWMAYSSALSVCNRRSVADARNVVCTLPSKKIVHGKQNIEFECWAMCLCEWTLQRQS